MNESEAKELISAWNAYVCPIPGGAMQTWLRFMADEQEYNLISDAISIIADKSAEGVYKRNPNLGNLQAVCKSLRLGRAGESNKIPDCSICLSTGLLSMVIAMNFEKHRQVPVAYQVAIPSSKADVVNTPCSCERGIVVMSPTFITKGSIKSDEGRFYNEDQVKRLAINCGYSTRQEAEEYRQKCEKFYFAWVEKYPGKKIDQSIGYKGKENKQVRGFWTEPERRYEP